MGIAAALWDAVSKAANLAQISGLLVAVGSSLLRITQSKRECARLERCSRRLHALLQWPTGCGIALLCSEMGGPAVKALVDAAGLVDDYKKSTLWSRVRRGRSMANQLRDMQDVVESYCGLLLFINAHLLLQQAAHHPTLSDTPTSTTTIHEVNVRSQTQSVQAVSSCPRIAATRDTQRTNNDTGEGGIGSQRDNTDPAGCERSVTDQ